MGKRGRVLSMWDGGENFLGGCYNCLPCYINEFPSNAGLGALVFDSSSRVLLLITGILAFGLTGIKRFVYISAADFGVVNYLLQGYYEGKVIFSTLNCCDILCNESPFARKCFSKTWYKVLNFSYCRSLSLNLKS